MFLEDLQQTPMFVLHPLHVLSPRRACGLEACPPQLSCGYMDMLACIGELLRLCGDPDWKIYVKKRESFATGVRIGYKEKMPRTPAIYERKTHWHHYSEDLESGIPQSKSNYSTVRDNVDKIDGRNDIII